MSQIIKSFVSAAGIQTIPVLDESELPDGQMKEVDFAGGKVLVARLGDKVVSTSAFCSHYGASLAKGVLTSDGRITCPWHGACFNASTGDIEDAPAPNAIHSFPVHLEGGKIMVTADPKYTKKDDNCVRAPNIVSSFDEVTSGVVIVGGGAGTIHALQSLRENGYKDPITVLTKETNAPLDRTKLSKALITNPTKIEWRSADELTTKFGVRLQTGVTVTAVDTKSKTVTLEDGNKVPYTILILAPGSTPRRLPIPGASLSNVFTLRRIEDAQKIDKACQKGKRLVVVGTSFISMEVAGTVAKREMASVDMIGMEEFAFENILGREVGKGMMTVMGKGVTFHMQTTVDTIKEDPANPGVASSVVLKNGTELPADVVVLGVGVGPATEFLKEGSGIKLEKDGGVLVDEYLKVPGVDDVYAIGDIAVFPQTENPTPRRIEHWNVASNHGRAVGRTIMGQGAPFSKIPVFWSAQGMRYCGLGGKLNYDDELVQGNPSEGKFVAYYFKDNKVVAVASMGRDPVVMKCSELMRLGKMPTAEQIKSGHDILTVDISSVGKV